MLENVLVVRDFEANPTGDVADGEVPRHPVGRIVERHDVGALEGDAREFPRAEVIRRTQVKIPDGIPGIDAGRLYKQVHAGQVGRAVVEHDGPLHFAEAALDGGGLSRRNTCASTS